MREKIHEKNFLGKNSQEKFCGKKFTGKNLQENFLYKIHVFQRKLGVGHEVGHGPRPGFRRTLKLFERLLVLFLTTIKSLSKTLLGNTDLMNNERIVTGTNKRDVYSAGLSNPNKLLVSNFFLQTTQLLISNTNFTVHLNIRDKTEKILLEVEIHHLDRRIVLQRFFIILFII